MKKEGVGLSRLKKIEGSLQVDPSQPLKNVRQENFCLLLTGYNREEPLDIQSAYHEAFGAKNRTTLANSPYRLMNKSQAVRNRIRWLRSQMADRYLIEKMLARRDILKKRLRIVESAIDNGDNAVALTGLRDIEKSYGIDSPEVERSAEVEESATADNDGLVSVREALKKVVTKVRE